MSTPRPSSARGAGQDRPMPERRIALIANPSAGGGRSEKLLPDVQERLAGHGLAVHTSLTESLDHGRGLAGEAAARGDIPVILSGDGLVGAAAAALRDIPEATMGVIPGGRGNDFARIAGIPFDPLEACDVIADGEPRAFDLGEADGASFIGIASLGFDSDANRIANEAPGWLGGAAYAYAALRALAGWKHARFTVDVDGDVRSFSGWSVVAANSQAYGGGMLVAPHADLHDGMVDVILSQECSKLRFLTQLPTVFKGTHVDSPMVHELRGRTVRISADRPFVVYADGDPIGELPITVRIVRDAVRVLVPVDTPNGPTPAAT
jgi:YegS/Rv2252/BmrU family lipid kinase